MKDLFSPPDSYVWDQWFIEKDGKIYAFFQQNIKSSLHTLRRDNVFIGAAVAKDNTLFNWDYLGAAIKPGEQKEDWDSQACWTGSIIRRKDGTYAQLYTGRSKRQNEYWIQRIGLATSNDLLTWEKHPDNPIFESDPHYYEMDNIITAQGNVKAWRDPFLFHDPATDTIYAIISANKKHAGEYAGALAIAEALNDELSQWKIHPPILFPGQYAEMEASQIINHNGIWYIFFYTWLRKMNPEYAKKHAITGGGMQCYYSYNLFGEYKPVNSHGSVTINAEEPYGMYCAKIIDRIDEHTYRGLGWLNEDEQQAFVGVFSNPFTITINKHKIHYNS